MLAAHFMELGKSGGYGIKYRVRADYDLKAAIHATGHSYRSFMGEDNHLHTHITQMSKGSNIRRKTGERITKRLGVPFDTVFELIQESASLAPVTVKGAQSALNAIFNAAVKAEIITVNPLNNVDMPKIGDIERPALTSEQARLFLGNLSSIEHIGVRAILVTLLFTGARTGELRALVWSDVNLHLADAVGEYGLISISKGVDDKNRIAPPKTKSSNRIIKIDGVLLAFLRHYRQAQAEQITAAGSRWIDKDLVFPSLTGDYMSANLPTKIVKRCIRGTDIDPKLHAHSMRHSFASILIDSGANVKTVQDALGHSSSRMTLDTYTQSFAEARAKATQAVSLAITGGDNLLITDKLHDTP